MEKQSEYKNTVLDTDTESKPLIIGIVGPICSGKEELAVHLQEKYQVKRNFAATQNTKAILQNLFQIMDRHHYNFQNLSGKQFKNILANLIKIEQLLGKEPIEQDNSENGQQDINFQLLQQVMEHIKMPGNTDKLLEQVQQTLNKEKNSFQENTSINLSNQQSYSPKNHKNMQNRQELHFEESNVSVLNKLLKKWFIEQTIYPIQFQKELDVMRIRNFFHLICVEAPILDRWQRFLIKYDEFVQKYHFKLEHFLALDDFITYNSDLGKLMHKANYKLQNSNSLSYFQNDIDNKKLQIIRSFRPTWDEYFMTIAYVLKTRSNCMKTSVGALLARNNRIVSTGYNGTPQNLENCYNYGCKDCNLNYSNQPKLDQCICLHAEEAAILEAGVLVAKDCTLYATTFPCVWCAKCIVQARIKKLCYHQKGINQEDSLQILQGHLIIQQIELSEIIVNTN